MSAQVKEEESVIVKCELLTATVKLFFKRPPEVQKMMGRLFQACLGDSVNPLVHDRALLYFRLLRANVREASSVIGGERTSVADFHDETAPEVREKIWKEFNSLSVVYGKPSEEFISTDHLIAAVPLDAEVAGGRPAGRGQGDDDRLLDNADDDVVVGTGASAGPVGAGGGSSTAAAPEVDLLGEDLLGLGSGSSAPSNAGAGASFGGFVPVSLGGGGGGGGGGLGFGMVAPAPPAVTLVPPSAPLDPGTYQAKWGMLATSNSSTFRAGRVPSTAEVEALARAGNVFSIASGDVSTALKFFLYGQDSQAGYHLFQVLLDKTNGEVSVTVKSDIATNAPQAVAGLAAALRPLPLMG